MRVQVGLDDDSVVMVAVEEEPQQRARGPSTAALPDKPQARAHTARGVQEAAGSPDDDVHVFPTACDAASQNSRHTRGGAGSCAAREGCRSTQIAQIDSQLLRDRQSPY